MLPPTDPSTTRDAPKKRGDVFAVLAFYLSVLIMVCPIEVDLVAGSFAFGHVLAAGVTALACSATVLTPIMLSWRRRRRDPERWRNRGHLIGAVVILAINSVMFGTIFVAELFRSEPRQVLKNPLDLLEDSRPVRR